MTFEIGKVNLCAYQDFLKISFYSFQTQLNGSLF